MIETKKEASNSNTYVNLYTQFVLDNNKLPFTLYELCKNTKCTEGEILQAIGNLNKLSRLVYSQAIHTTCQQLTAQEEFSTFPVEHKIMTLFFGWIEHCRENKSFWRVSLHYSSVGFLPTIEKSLSAGLLDWFNQHVLSDETVIKRPWISSFYIDALVVHLLTVTKFWLGDVSEKEEKTDLLIDKLSQLYLQSIQKNAMDTLWDIGGFIVKNTIPFKK